MQRGCVTPEKHHPAGPSRLGRLALCPGSYALSQEAERRGLVLEEFGEEATEGTHLHSLVPPNMDLKHLDEEPRAAVLKAREYIAAKTEGAEAVLYEAPLELWWQGRLISQGTADVIAIVRNNPHVVIDLKFGRQELERDLIFWQLVAYGVMWAQRADVAVDCYAFAPRLGLELMERLDDPGKVHEMAQAIAGVAEKARLSGAMRIRHPAACRYCAGKPICPEWQEELALVPKKEYLPADVAQLERLVELCALVQSVGPAAREKLKEMIEAGMPSERYEVAIRRLRTPKDVETVFAMLEGVLDQAEFLKVCKVQLGPLEKAVKAKDGGVAGLVIESQTKYLRRKGTSE